MIHKELFEIYPYKFNKKDKKVYFSKGIENLTNFHRKKCKEYNKILNCKLSNYSKNKYLNYTIRKYRSIIYSNFIAKTEKDRIVKKIFK